MLAGTWSIWSSPLLLVGINTGVATLENNWQVPKKLNVLLPLNPASSPWHLTGANENLRSRKTLHVDVYRSFIHHYQSLKATRMSSRGWVGK